MRHTSERDTGCYCEFHIPLDVFLYAKQNMSKSGQWQSGAEQREKAGVIDVVVVVRKWLFLASGGGGSGLVGVMMVVILSVL